MKVLATEIIGSRLFRFEIGILSRANADKAVTINAVDFETIGDIVKISRDGEITSTRLFVETAKDGLEVSQPLILIVPYGLACPIPPVATSCRKLCTMNSMSSSSLISLKLLSTVT